MPAPYEKHHAQLKAILSAWGMPEDNAESTADILGWADLHGVDSHGISMLPGYDRLRRSGRANMQARPRTIKETPVSALVDGDGGLGHVAGAVCDAGGDRQGQAAGMAIAAVRNSAHFGATGYYTLMAAKAGLIGMACTSASSIQVAPTFGKEAKLGTDPWSFAAPSADGPPFLLDMATTTVAAGRIRNKANEGLPCPPGWVLDKDGRPSTDPRGARKGRVPDLARRLAGKFELQGLWAGGHGQHPRRVPVGRDPDYRPDAGKSRRATTSAIALSRSIRGCSATRGIHRRRRPLRNDLRATKPGRSGPAGHGRGRSAMEQRRQGACRTESRSAPAC